jgi:putative transposase
MANKLNFKVTKFKELTEIQWQFIKPLVTTQRKIKKDLRIVINAILFITRTGVQWRNLDTKYGAWESVYYYFRKWKKSGVLENILVQLVHKQRVALGRNAEATACAIDSQSVKVVPLTKNAKGIDGNKLVNGRKRHIIVDTVGLPIAIFVGSANISDGIAGLELLSEITKTTKILRIIRGDNAYKGSFKVAASYFGYEVEVKQRPETSKGFVPETGRWQVERSFAWLSFYRRLSKDYEKTTQSAVSFIQLAFISIILAKF